MRALVLFILIGLCGPMACMSFDWENGVLPCEQDADCPSGMRCAFASADVQLCFYAEQMPDTAETQDSHESDTGSGTGSLPTDTGTAGSTDTGTGSSDTFTGSESPSLTVETQETVSETHSESVPDSDTAACRNDADCQEVGECGVPDCVVDTGSDTVDESYCRYTADSALCEPEGGCSMLACLEDLNGPGYECVFSVDPEACNAGEVCAWDGNYGCEGGVCPSIAVRGPTRHTAENQGDLTVDMAAMAPSLVATSTGFAAVYGRAEVIDAGAGKSYDYKALRFVRFDASGEIEIAPQDIAMTLGGRYPQLLELGSSLGLVLVYQMHNGLSHEVMIMELSYDGTVAMGPIGVSSVDSRDSFWPDAALKAGAGAQGRVGIAWSDTRDDPSKSNATALTEVYGAVYDVATNSLFATDERLTDNTNHDRAPAIVAVPDGFLVATHESTANHIKVRLVSDNGVPEPLADVSTVRPAGTAARPISMAYNGSRVAIAWRSGDGPENKGIYRIGLLTPTGEPVLGAEFVAGAPLAPGLSVSNVLGFGSLEVYWHADRGAFGICYDSQPQVYNGDSNKTIPSLAYAVVTDDVPLAQAGWPLATADAHHSLSPTCAVRADTHLVLWNDAQDESVADSWQGELYGATLSCE